MSKLTGYEKEIKQNDILSVQINPLNRCPSKCKSCRKYMWPDVELTYEEITNALYVLKHAFGLQSVFFSGGDPLMYKDFDKVIDFCVDNEISYSVITTLITTNTDLVKKIAKTAHRIHVSIDALENDLYKIIRGVDGIDYVKTNISIINENRDENKIPIRISSTIGALNGTKIIDLYSYAKQNRCLINFYLLHTWEDLKLADDMIGSFYYDLELIARDEQANKKVISNAKSLIISKYDFETKKCERCYLPYVSAIIDADGGLYPCCRLLDENGDYKDQTKFAYGNIKNKSLADLVDEFGKRKNAVYPIKNTICEECGQRYDGILNELQDIVENRREVLFF